MLRTMGASLLCFGVTMAGASAEVTYRRPEMRGLPRDELAKLGGLPREQEEIRGAT
jgi:hypothetical protein